MVEVKTNSRTLFFDPFQIRILQRNLSNRFADSSKLLGVFYEEIPARPKHKAHQVVMEDRCKYAEYQDFTVGQFLISLKQNGNPDYKRYLHPYGDEAYCEFYIDGGSSEKGLYILMVNDEIMYIGKCKIFEARINQNIGKITASDCLLDGTETNCRLNSLINQLPESAKIQAAFLNTNHMTDSEIIKLKNEILKIYKCPWNKFV